MSLDQKAISLLEQALATVQEKAGATVTETVTVSVTAAFNPALRLTEKDGGWLTVREASTFLSSELGRRIPPRTVQSWCTHKKNPLASVRAGQRIMIHRTDLLSYVKR